MVKVTVTKAMLQELQVATQKILKLYKLGGSDLEKSVEFIYKNDAFVLLAYDYFTYVSTGRRPRARKVPIEDLLKFIKEKSIVPRKGQTINQLAFAIQQSIYKVGIKAKNYLNPVVEVTTDIVAEDLAIDLAEQIATELSEEISRTVIIG